MKGCEDDVEGKGRERGGKDSGGGGRRRRGRDWRVWTDGAVCVNDVVLPAFDAVTRFVVACVNMYSLLPRVCVCMCDCRGIEGSGLHVAAREPAQEARAGRVDPRQLHEGQ